MWVYVLIGIELFIIAAAIVAARPRPRFGRVVINILAAHLIIAAAVLPFLAGAAFGLLRWSRRNG